MTREEKALIFDVQRFCVHDGPGIRSTVFFKGCNMRCAWCHNPESFSQRPELLFRPEKCTACGACEACPSGAHRRENGSHSFHRENCSGCGVCASLCPNGALELSGREMTVEEVMEELRKDDKYYAASGGGVTLSGGEASIWFNFVRELLDACKSQGFHTALETNGLISAERLEALIPRTDLFLFDCKHTDPEAHLHWTGAPLQPVLDSLQALDRAGAKVILRCPIIPGVNDGEAHFAALRDIRAKYASIQQVEVMAYHDVGRGKWQALGRSYAFEDLKTVPPDQKRRWQEQLSQL